MNTRIIPHLVILTVSLLLTMPAHAFYNPSDGNWTSRDPIGERGGANLYGMLGNNALYRVDKLGLKQCVLDGKPKFTFPGGKDIPGNTIVATWNPEARTSTAEFEQHAKFKGDEKECPCCEVRQYVQSTGSSGF